jgi:hypothetical protein
LPVRASNCIFKIQGLSFGADHHVATLRSDATSLPIIFLKFKDSGLALEYNIATLVPDATLCVITGILEIRDSTDTHVSCQTSSGQTSQKKNLIEAKPQFLNAQKPTFALARAT